MKKNSNLVKYEIPVKEIPYLDSSGVPIDTLISRLKNILKNHSSGEKTPIISIGGGYDGLIDIEIYAWRPKTEKEIATAKKRSESAKIAAAKRAQKKKEKELREYERLKKRLGK